MATSSNSPDLVRPSYSAASAYGQIGFIGLGAMGHHMAFNLLKSGFSLTVYDQSPTAAERLRLRLDQAGLHTERMQLAASPKDVAGTNGVQAVITMLPATSHVQEVYEGPHGLLAAQGGVRPALLLDCSTISPTYTRDLAQRLRRHSSPQVGSSTAPPYPVRPLLFMDAPVSGGVPGAEAASLTFMCGGQQEALDLALPLLSSMGRRVMHMGPDQGMGQVAKLCNNLACGIEMAAVSEALALGAAAGLDPKQLSQVLNTSSGRCWSSEAYNPCPGVMPGVPSSSSYQGGFSSALMLKDLNLALALADAHAQPSPMGQAAAQLYAGVVAECEAQGKMLDFSSIYQLVYGGKGAARD